MCTRSTRRTNTVGSSTGYLQLDRNERDPRAGHPVAKIIWNVGRDDSVDKKALNSAHSGLSSPLSADEPWPIHIPEVFMARTPVPSITVRISLNEL